MAHGNLVLAQQIQQKPFIPFHGFLFHDGDESTVLLSCRCGCGHKMRMRSKPRKLGHIQKSKSIVESWIELVTQTRFFLPSHPPYPRLPRKEWSFQKQKQKISTKFHVFCFFGAGGSSLFAIHSNRRDDPSTTGRKPLWSTQKPRLDAVASKRRPLD